MKTSIKIFFYSFLLFTFNSHKVHSQLVSDFRVNDDTTNYSQYRAKVGTDNNGNFVVVWYDQRSGSNIRLKGQLFDSNANRIRNSFQINDDIYNTIPSLSVRGDGSFAVSWNVISLKFRIFDNLGLPLSDEIILEDTVTGFVNALGCDSAGNFIVIFNQDSSTINNLYYQKLNQIGKKIGSKVKVSDISTISTYQGMAIAVKRDGSCLITWNDKRPPAGSDADDIYFQMFDRFGNRIGANQKVNDDASNFNLQLSPKISSDISGRFVIAWYDDRLNNSHSEIYAQNYLNDGSKFGINYRVSESSTNYDKGICNIFKKENGEFLIGWTESRPFISSPYFQRYDSSGIKIGNNFLVSNQLTTIDKIYSDLIIHNNKIISVWNDERNDPFDIYCNIRSFTNPDTTVNIIQTSSSIPENFLMHQNYPNPFNSSTIIEFEIKQSDNYKLEIVNSLGQVIQILFQRNFYYGTYQFNLDATNLSSGMYYSILSSKKERIVKSFVILK